MNIEITLAPADGSEDNPVLNEFLRKLADLMEAGKTSFSVIIDDEEIRKLWSLLAVNGRISWVIEVPSGNL